MPSDHGKLAGDYRIQFIHSTVPSGHTLADTVLVNVVKLVVEVRGVVQTGNWPWLAIDHHFLDGLPAMFHQNIVGIFAAVWIFDLPASVLADASSNLFCHCLTGAVTVCRYDDTVGCIYLFFCVP